MPWTLRRRAARLILLDGERRVLLLRASDPGDAAKPPWWEIPGGGIDPGETSEDAARRELQEETGITGAVIGPCVWTQHASFDFGGWHFDQDEWIHVGWVNEAGEYRPEKLEALEALAFSGARWWPVDELLASDEPVLPDRLRDFLPGLAAGEVPDEPVDVGEAGGPAGSSRSGG